MRVQSFSPIASSDSKILILGTMPGNESLNTGQYYAHSSNHFWDIMFRVLNDSYDFFRLAQENESYENKIDLLRENRIALWDTLKFCDRKGNLDRDILNEIKNDFDSFFNNHMEIENILFNGQKAHKYFIESFSHIVNQRNIKLNVLNSTSSSNSKNIFGILNEWKNEIKNAI